MKKRFIFPLLALALGNCLALIAGEVALRIYNPIGISLRGSQIVLPHGLTLRHANPDNQKVDPEVVEAYNTLGFRGPEPPRDWAAHISIVTVGGSTTHCLHQTDGNTWPDHVAARLSERFEHIWLNNAGFDGHSTFGHLRLLDQALAELSPTFIVYLVGVNDVARDDLDPGDQVLEDFDLTERLAHYSDLVSTVQILYRSLKAYDLGLNHHTDSDWTTHPKAAPSPQLVEARMQKLRDHYLPLYEARLRRLVAETQRAGSIPVLVTQPALYGDYVDPTTGVEMGHLAGHDEIDAITHGQELDLYNAITRRVAKDTGVPLIELADRMPQDSKYYYDWMHYSNAGVTVVADIVAEGLAPHIASVIAAR